jgi:hypothetical protein
MRKTLSPLAWSTSLNEALSRPTYSYYPAGITGKLLNTGQKPKSCSNQLQDQFQTGKG